MVVVSASQSVCKTGLEALRQKPILTSCERFRDSHSLVERLIASRGDQPTTGFGRLRGKSLGMRAFRHPGFVKQDNLTCKMALAGEFDIQSVMFLLDSLDFDILNI
eukprot:1466248-Amphidinium_carterae.1